jgi:outer membrane protein assembly factor BamB
MTFASRGARAMLVGAALAVTVGAPAFAVTAGQVYGPLFHVPIIGYGPCLLSIFSLPATREEHCLPWTRRESSGPAFHVPSGLVVMGGSDSKLHAHHARDGSPLYAVPLPGAAVARPTFSGPHVFVGTDDGHVVRADITSGRKGWDVTVDAEVIEPVVVDGDDVFVMTGLDTLYAFDRRDGSSRWVHKQALPRGITLRGQAKPLVVDLRGIDGSVGRVFVGHASGSLTSLDRETGQVVATVELGRAEAFNDVDADPILQAGQIIAASHSGGIFALDPMTLTQTWHLDEKGIVRLASAGKHMAVAASAGTVLGIDAVRGDVRWRFTYERGAPTRIVVKGGRVHVGSDRGSLYVLDLFTGEPLQYYGSGLGVAADPELVGDMLFIVSTSGELHALSNAFAGVTQRKSPSASRLPTTR